MSASTQGSEETIADYYDSDYPAIGEPPFDNLDEACLSAGVASDVALYARLSRGAGTTVLDVGAGTGRLSLPLARLGMEVTAIEPSAPMRARLAEGHRRWSERGQPLGPLRIVESITDVPKAPRYDAAALLFGVLTSVADIDAQIALLRAVRARLRPGGLVALDVPRALGMGQVAARPSWIRRHAQRGTRYTRVAGVTAIDRDQKVRLYGSYEEEGAAPKPFSITQRLVFPGELRLMLERAGLDLIAVAGDIHGGDTGHRSFAVARRRGDERAFTPWIPKPPRGAAETALATAAARAKHMEQAGEGALLRDPFALRLAGADGFALFADLGGMALIGATIARARFFDAQIEAALERGATTIVSLGAGLCTRAWRGALRDAAVIEIDGAEMIAYKEALLADQPAPKGRRAVAADLSTPAGIARMSAELASIRGPFAVIAEGLLPYLAPPIAGSLVSAVEAALGPEDVMIFDTCGPAESNAAGFLRALSKRGIDWHAPPPSVQSPSAARRITTTPIGAADTSRGLAHPSSGATQLHVLRRAD